MDVRTEPVISPSQEVGIYSRTSGKPCDTNIVLIYWVRAYWSDSMDDDYTIDEAIDVLKATVARKADEIAALEKKMRRLKKEDTRAKTQELIDYLRADRTAYITVIADMTEDDSLLEGLDLDTENTVDCPVMYDQYLNGLDADDLENELDAEEIRAEYCDEVVELMCQGIGEMALTSKKLMKLLAEDEYACSVIGELIFYDDDLYDAFRKIVEAKAEKKAKKKKKD